MTHMYFFKSSNGGVRFIGWNDETRIFSRSFYANDRGECIPVKMKDIKRMTAELINAGYTEKIYIDKKYL